MKSYLLKAALLASGAALAFGAAAPAQADPVLSGYVDAWAALGTGSDSYREAYYFENGSPDTEDGCDGTNICEGHDHDHFNALGGDGRAAIQWASGFGIQLDAQGSDANFHEEGYDDETTDLAAHFFQRSDDMLWGGFASIGGWDGSRYGTVGAEFQKYWNDWTFYAQASWSKGLTSYAAYEHQDSWNINAQARYFVSSHLLLTGGVGWDSGSSHGIECCASSFNSHEDSWNWTLRAEWLMDSMPVSIFGEYAGSYTRDHGGFVDIDDGNEDGDFGRETGHVNGNLFMIGVRLFLNQQDLMTNDRTGASLEDFNPWTGKYSTIGYGGEVEEEE